jgi:hypothetical protein
MKYGTAELLVRAVVMPQIDPTAATPSPTPVGDYMDTVDIVRGQSEMPAVTSRSGSSQMRLSSEIPQSHQFIPVLFPSTVTDLVRIQDGKPDEPVSCYACIKHR